MRCFWGHARLNGEADAFGGAVFRVEHGLRHVLGRLAGQGVVEVADEEVAVVEGERHEGAAHENELHLVHGVAQAPELVEAAAGLDERVVSGQEERGPAWDWS